MHLLRKKHNYTQDELAKRLDISRQAVSKWETGAAIPDLEVLLKISKLYGITINDILEPNIPTKKITDFEQLSKVPENELREILEKFDMTSLVIASMGASPEINNLLEKLFPDVDYKMERNCIGRVRVDEVERILEGFLTVKVTLCKRSCTVSFSYATNLKPCGLFRISSIVARISFSVGISIIPTAVK